MNPGELISGCKINGLAMNPGELISGCKINGLAMNPGVDKQNGTCLM